MFDKKLWGKFGVVIRKFGGNWEKCLIRNFEDSLNVKHFEIRKISAVILKPSFFH